MPFVGTHTLPEIEKKLEGQDTARAAEKNNLRKEWNEEAREREVRRKNIVVHRLPEAEATEAATRKNWDMDSRVHHIFEIEIVYLPVVRKNG